VVNVKFGDVEGKEELYDDSGKMLLQEVARWKSNINSLIISVIFQPLRDIDQ